MSLLPRVTEHTRESVVRQFDDLGPQSCVAEITADMSSNNPELLDMAERCARDLGEPERIMVGLCMFYRLLSSQAASGEDDSTPPQAQLAMSALPRVTPETRNLVVEEIDRKGPAAFTEECLGRLQRHNPELLQMAHNFADRYPQYLQIMQGMALLWASLAAQLEVDRAHMH